MDIKSNSFTLSHRKVTWIFRQNKFKPELIDCDKLKPEVEEEADRGDYLSLSLSPVCQNWSLCEGSGLLWVVFFPPLKKRVPDC